MDRLVDKEELRKTLDLTIELFEQVKEFLFISQWMREETSLVFLLELISLDTVEAYMVWKNGEKYDWKKAADDTQKCQFTYLLIGLPDEEDCGIVVRYACQSPCFDMNIGRMLLTNMLKVFGEALWEVNPADEIGIQAFPLEVLDDAKKNVREMIEQLYFPVRLSYINSLSGAYYEKSECSAGLIFLPPGIAVDTSILSCDFLRVDSAESGIELNFKNIRWIRKLLQIAQGGQYMIFQVNKSQVKYEVLGICHKDMLDCLLKQEGGKIPCLKAEIRQHAKWDLYLGLSYIFTYNNGNYTIEYKMSDAYLRENCQRVFGAENCYSRIIKGIEYASKQSHGTMLVVLEEEVAQHEAKRLASLHAGMVNPNLELNIEELEHLSAIDGSIIMDTKGQICGIGVILDGDGETEMDPARGARLNSARKYQNYLKKKRVRGMILVVSEDGSVEILNSSI